MANIPNYLNSRAQDNFGNNAKYEVLTYKLQNQLANELAVTLVANENGTTQINMKLLSINGEVLADQSFLAGQSIKQVQIDYEKKELEFIVLDAFGHQATKACSLDFLFSAVDKKINQELGLFKIDFSHALEQLEIKQAALNETATNLQTQLNTTATQILGKISGLEQEDRRLEGLNNEKLQKTSFTNALAKLAGLDTTTETALLLEALYKQLPIFTEVSTTGMDKVQLALKPPKTDWSVAYLTITLNFVGPALGEASCKLLNGFKNTELMTQVQFEPPFGITSGQFSLKMQNLFYKRLQEEAQEQALLLQYLTASQVPASEAIPSSTAINTHSQLLQKYSDDFSDPAKNTPSKLVIQRPGCSIVANITAKWI